ncbi:MAG TPA: Hsp70 family protein, partial [Candidatus Eremiobacteraceae bacterium]|nr:Hsp70 family protein [Candidatus Eremiobacteraceae bacterium]
RKPFEQALADAKLSIKDINEVVLVGGSTRMPAIIELVKQLTGKEPHQGVNPDEVVAVGAAIQAGVLSGDVKNVVLLDVTPLSLGLETLGGVMTKLIERNTTIPTRKSQIFTTAEDGQTSVDISVFQGEREMARANKALGQFRLEGIAPAPRGVPQVEVGFDIDANGITHVSAKDLGTGKEQRITITSSSNLSKDEVDRMVREAETHADDDRKQREAADVRNRADQLVYVTEKTLKEVGDKAAASDRQDVEKALENLRSLLKTGTPEELTKASDQLQEVSLKLGQHIYDQAKASADASGAANGNGAATGDGATAGAGAASAPEGDVIDAEFKER